MEQKTFIYINDNNVHVFCNECVEINNSKTQKIDATYETCEICGFANELIVVTKMYLHGDKGNNMYKFEELAEEYGFKIRDEALKKFMYALYEVEFDVEINTYTGEYKIIKVNDKALCIHDDNRAVTYR